GWQGLETGEKMPRNALIVGVRGVLPLGCCGGVADLRAVFGLVGQWVLPRIMCVRALWLQLPL
ncbi:hypothetical protein, partial [Helicobacter ailurogastricus]|uniref:hypothetical protein n=1 Tax=Helicobacter ailurogastricus TaxID=1578720 RepID=UPI002557967B